MGLVVAGAVLAAGVYGSLLRDEAAVKEAGARRIAAATGAATTSQPVSMRPPEFSARHALQELYGNYDPVVDGAYWTVTGAPNPWREWNGKTVAIKPLISRTDDAAARHILLTNSVEVEDGMVTKQGAGCRTCKSLLGAALFQRRANKWELVSEHRFLSIDGARGAPPQVAVAFLDSGAVELRFSRGSEDRLEGRAPGPTFVVNGGKVVKIDAPRPELAVASARPALRAQPPVEPPQPLFPSAASGP